MTDQSTTHRSMNLPTLEEIKAMPDKDLVQCKQRLHVMRNSTYGESDAGHPKRARWCFHEVKQEVERRGLAGRPTPRRSVDRAPPMLCSIRVKPS